MAHLECSCAPRARGNTVPVLDEAIGMATADEIVSRPLLRLANGLLSETLPTPSCSAVSTLAPVTSMPRSQRLGAPGRPLAMHILIRGTHDTTCVCMLKHLGRGGVARQTPRRSHSLFLALLSLLFSPFPFFSRPIIIAMLDCMGKRGVRTPEVFLFANGLPSTSFIYSCYFRRRFWIDCL